MKEGRSNGSSIGDESVLSTEVYSGHSGRRRSSWKRNWKYPLKLLDRFLQAGKLFVTFEAIGMGAELLKEACITLRHTADAAADTAHEANEAIQHTAWAVAASYASTMATAAVGVLLHVPRLAIFGM